MASASAHTKNSAQFHYRSTAQDRSESLGCTQDQLEPCTGATEVKGMVLEPTTLAVDMSMNGPSGNLGIRLSNIRLNLSPDILELAMSLQSSVLEPLIQPPAEQPVSKCTKFAKVLISSLQCFLQL